MRARALLVAAATMVAGCPRPSPSPARAFAPEFTEVAEAELRRDDGVAALAALAGARAPEVRAAALRGLARVGSRAAVDELRRRMAAEPRLASSALGLAGALDVLEPEEREAVAGEVRAALAAGTGDAAPLLAALGRLGDAVALPALAAALREPADGPAVAAGYAVGRLARRGVAPDRQVVEAAAARAADLDRDARYAAVYALSRGVVPGDAAPAAGDVAVAALVARLDDVDPEIRALALAGLGRRTGRAAGGAAVVEALADPDWRVAVEAARLLASPTAPTADVDALATAARREWAALEAGGEPARAHALLEALRALLPHGGGAAAGLFDELAASLRRTTASARPPALRLAAAHVHALVAAASLRRAPAAEVPAALAWLDAAPLPGEVADAVLGALAAEALAARLPGDPGAAAQLVARAGGPVVGRRAAALAALPGAWPHLADRRDDAVRTVLAALDGDRPEVVGAAADAGVALLRRDGAGPRLTDAEQAGLGDALRAALGEAADPELRTALLSAAAALGPDGGAACAAALADANPTVRGAARACVTEATGRDPGPGAAPPLPPPDGVSIRDVAGRTFRWELETTRGTVAIALRGELAPWHVATVRSLTRRGFYDGLVVHRVVPGFVAQGGDPTGTGWGGPGFTLPSEAGDAAYERGAVGFADAGKDTGGSQWFVMHAAAPHLEGRYTVIGRVVAGQDVVDALLVGDRVLRAAIVDP